MYMHVLLPDLIFSLFYTCTQHFVLFAMFYEFLEKQTTIHRLLKDPLGFLLLKGTKYELGLELTWTALVRNRAVLNTWTVMTKR